jgi:hypothetical protein
LLNCMAPTRRPSSVRSHPSRPPRLLRRAVRNGLQRCVALAAAGVATQLPRRASVSADLADVTHMHYPAMTRERVNHVALAIIDMIRLPRPGSLFCITSAN